MLALAVDNIGFSALFPIIASLFQDHPSLFFGTAASLQKVDLFMAIAYMTMPFGMFLGASFLGDLSDVWGRRKTLVLAMIGVGVGYLFLTGGVWLGSLLLFYIGRLITGLMAGSQSIAQASIIDLSTPKTKMINMSLITFAVSVGFIIGPMIAGFFSSIVSGVQFGYELPLLIIGLLALLSALWIGRSYQETAKKNKTKEIHWLRPLYIFVEAFRHPLIRILSLIFFIYQFGIALFFTLIPVKMLEQFHYSLFGLGIFTAYWGFWIMVALLWIVKITLHLCHVGYYALFMTFINALSIIAIAYADSQVAVWSIVVICSITNALAYVAILALFSDATDAKNQGWAMGIAVSMSALAFLAGGGFTSLLPTLGVNNSLAVSSGLMMLSSVMLFFYVKKQHFPFKAQ